MKWLLFLVIVVPVADLTLLLYAGSKIGVLSTIIILFITALVGIFFAKKQGIRALADLQRRIATMETPGSAMIDNVCILIGGILLILPGFITDFLGILLLIPFVRHLLRPLIVKWIYKKIKNGRIVIM